MLYGVELHKSQCNHTQRTRATKKRHNWICFDVKCTVYYYAAYFRILCCGFVCLCNLMKARNYGYTARVILVCILLGTSEKEKDREAEWGQGGEWLCRCCSAERIWQARRIRKQTASECKCLREQIQFRPISGSGAPSIDETFVRVACTCNG